MTKVLGYKVEELERMKAAITANEIQNQPQVWKKLADVLEENKTNICNFMEMLSKIKDLRVILAGAGSSAFIGESAKLLLQLEKGLISEDIHTTEIVATPDAVLYDRPTVLVSYSRSGSSPESMGAISMSEKYVKELYNIVFVCNKNSSLSRMEMNKNSNLVINIPQEAHDKGFAMTCSVTCMMLATWCVFGYENIDERIAAIRSLADEAVNIIPQLDEKAKEIAKIDFKRIVYLGFGALRGLAREGAVKLQELTNGTVVAIYDTPTGFRHGPKTIVDDNTLSVHLVSPVEFTRKYDVDLLNELSSQRKGNKTVAVVAKTFAKDFCQANDIVEYPLLDGDLNKELCSYIFGVLFIQLLSFEKSLNLGVTTDNPCPNGEVNRVVQGVEIYEK